MVKHIVDTRQLRDREFLEGLFTLADKMKKQVEGHNLERGYERKIVGGWDKIRIWKDRLMRRGAESHKLEKRHEGRIILNFFSQPSMRTRTAFESAEQRLGASIVTIDNAEEFSSLYKGETLEHSLLATQGFFDAVVMRHSENGAAKRAAYVLEIPFINAGDGTNQHPTQALLDLYTLRQKFERIDNLKVAFSGDIKHGRTIRSLAYLLAHLKNNELTFVSPKELGLPDDMISYFAEKKINFCETDKLDEVIPNVDALYVTRLQWEYIKDEEKRKALMESYRRFQITSKRANMMGTDSIIMHPLPINREKSDGFPEITPDVDTNYRAWYFVQSRNGLYVRMALLDVLLSGYTNSLYDKILDVFPQKS